MIRIQIKNVNAPTDTGKCICSFRRLSKFFEMSALAPIITFASGIPTGTGERPPLQSGGQKATNLTECDEKFG